MFNAQKGMPVSWTCYISVPDVDRSAADIKRLGGTVANGPMEVPGGDKIVVGKDPKGGLFALHWVKPK
jgi:hypothetical protein